MFVNRDFVLGALLLLLLGCGKGTHDPNQGPGAIAVGESVPVVDPADLKALRHQPLDVALEIARVDDAGTD